MFYRFYVNPEHRNFLRFFWFKDNNPALPLTEYRMRVHVFGNRPSPAVATYGLRKSVENAAKDVHDFVNHDFYVDDAITSVPTSEQAVSLLKRTQKELQDVGKIRLHKIASNDVGLMDQFPKEDLGKDLKDLDISSDLLPLQRSLGLAWNINIDQFVFDAPSTEKSFTRRGLLSAISSIFDPIGFVSPLTVSGKILMRLACPEGISWDETLPSVYKDSWISWCDSLHKLNGFEIPRMYVPSSLSSAKEQSLLIYSDASESAVAAAAYILVKDSSGQDRIGFVLGKAKLAPPGGTSIPRLELCAALLATELGHIITEQLEIAPTSIKYFTDSKVVLGYIRNKKRRFYTYVCNRVARIHHISLPEQWNYVPSHKNPADAATRESSSEIIPALQKWLQGPLYLLDERDNVCESQDFPLLNPEEDTEIRPVQSMKIALSTTDVPVAEYFNRASSWNGLVQSIAMLQHIAHTYHKDNAHQCKGWHICKESKTVDARKDAENLILRVVQRQNFDKEIECLKQKTDLPRNSPIISLSPYIDDKGLLRVGGRLNNMTETLGLSSVNPVIVPKGHISLLLARYYHERCYHQGRKFTEGQLRSNGYWILGAKRLVSSLIFTCVPCRKLRGKVREQKMADLPKDRLTPGPPFSAVGVDMFGPWQITTRKTRGGAAQSKRWAILFTCLTTRAIHIEVVEDMSSSSFINSLRRFTAIRGPVNVYRSDRGTNFVGATDQLEIHSINVEDDIIQDHLRHSSSVWKFNPPNSSHMGGVWERMIGVTRNILNGMLLNAKGKELTHEILCTLMAEVSAIVNSRPITSISTDPDSPIILSPNILLTQKQGEVPSMAGEFNLKDIYTASWKHVQFLADLFWKKWYETYLCELQTRRKWCQEKPNIKVGDVVLVKDKNVPRSDWPIGIMEQAIESDDDLVRKAVIRLNRENKCVTYTRPISDLILLVDE
ncbi:hypothetical protein FSP39_005438 [Pinctada imbricata]|uniref:DUF5641 domain-containing protein n=1 Tax=Pinctada imbricata TaxID=66713 RepID=A0AA88YKU6_PINIB|nr:hypothetical protein FSP39_005438 [Pinctada imbricata]